MNNSGKVLLGVLAGVAAGAVLGILFAPDSGSNTRRKILSKSDEYLGDMKKKFNDLLDSLGERVEKVKNETEEFANETIAQGKQKAQDLKRDIHSASEKMGI